MDPRNFLSRFLESEWSRLRRIAKTVAQWLLGRVAEASRPRKTLSDKPSSVVYLTVARLWTGAARQLRPVPIPTFSRSSYHFRFYALQAAMLCGSTNSENRSKPQIMYKPRRPQRSRIDRNQHVYLPTTYREANADKNLCLKGISGKMVLETQTEFATKVPYSRPEQLTSGFGTNIMTNFCRFIPGGPKK